MVHFKCLYLDRRKEVGGRGVIFLESVLNRRSTFSEETSKKGQESRRRYRQTENGERGIEIGRRERERERESKGMICGPAFIIAGESTTSGL